ncbi:MAG: EamA family transporter RarD [Actinomycetales bacterium]|nr:EamA family transporter RarD [Actinomycetales bacterium]
MFPVYFALLDSVSPLEILAHRIVWSFVLLAGIVIVTRSWGEVSAIIRSRRTILMLAGAAVFVAINWGTYVYAVSTDQVVESSLGYFINPMVSVGLGVLVLKERLRPLQWLAIGIALVAVLELTWSYGQIPWIGLALAFSFGSYGLLKKLVGAKAIPAMAVETAVLLPIASGFLIISEVASTASFVRDGAGISMLLILLGPITVIPLLAFNSAATRVPLSVLGILQYLTPSVIFLIGVFGFGEAMTGSRWAGFAIIWFALVIFGIDAWRRSRTERTPSIGTALEVAEPD